jgi:hypothetical protein
MLNVFSVDCVVLSHREHQTAAHFLRLLPAASGERANSILEEAMLHLGVYR